MGLPPRGLAGERAKAVMGSRARQRPTVTSRWGNEPLPPRLSPAPASANRKAAHEPVDTLPPETPPLNS